MRLRMRGMNLNLRILRMLEDTSSLGATHIMYELNSNKGSENVIILALYRGTWRHFTASTQLLKRKKRFLSLRKHAYSNILKLLLPKTKTFQIKTLIFFIFLLKTLIVGTR